MGACFRLGGAAGQSHRLRLPETVILPQRYFAPQRRRTERLQQDFFAQRSHTEKRRLDGWRTEKVIARLPCTKAAQRKGASNVRCLPALYAQRSHTEKRRLDGWRTERLRQGFFAQKRRTEKVKLNYAVHRYLMHKRFR